MDVLVLANESVLCAWLYQFLPRHNITLATSPEAARQLLSGRRYALVIITNFGLSPWDAAAVIPETRDYPVLFLTSLMDENLQCVCQRKGIAWKTGPFAEANLRRELRVALEDPRL
jgi:DNA-binding response OmpR family regulator